MTLQATGTITLNDVNVELGKSATAVITLNDTFVRATAKVATGAISMSDLYSKTVATVVNTNLTVDVDQLGQASDAWLSFDSDGGTTEANGFGTSTDGTNWLSSLSTGIGVLFEVQYSGLVDGSGTGTFTGYTTAWQRLDAATYPTLARLTYGTSTASYTYSIREVGTTTVLGTATVSLTATATSL